MTEEILAKLTKAESVEELTAILAENGIELEEGITPEALLAQMKAEGELNEDALDNVAGGGWFSWLRNSSSGSGKGGGFSAGGGGGAGGGRIGGR